MESVIWNHSFCGPRTKIPSLYCTSNAMKTKRFVDNKSDPNLKIKVNFCIVCKPNFFI